MRPYIKILTLLALLFFTLPAVTAFCCCVSGSHQHCTPQSQPSTKDCQSAHSNNSMERPSHVQLNNPLSSKPHFVTQTKEPSAIKMHFNSFFKGESPGPFPAINPQSIEVLRI
jgi:hypothetical protein